VGLDQLAAAIGHLGILACLVERAERGPRGPMGVTGDAVFQSVDDPNDVTVWHDFDTAAAARAFASSDELRNAMQQAGVQGELKVWFVTPR
jgi:hypothetical protein